MKYLISLDTYRQLRQALTPYVAFDTYGGEQGEYRVHSLYFEAPDYLIYYETKNRAKYRQKLRMRVYNQARPDDYAYLEIKKKHGNVVNKRRTQLRLKDAYRLIAGGASESIEVSNEHVLQEVLAFKGAYRLEPKLIVSYDRQALSGLWDPELRITFDRRLTCRPYDPLLGGGANADVAVDGSCFVDPGLVIVEVKVSDSVPLWLVKLLQEYRCLNKSVSKYCASLELLDPVIGSVVKENAESAKLVRAASMGI